MKHTLPYMNTLILIHQIQIDGDTGEGLTKAEVYQRTIRFAQNLMRLGCSSEHRIGIVAQNHQNLTPLLFAAFCIGSPISPMDVLMVEGDSRNFAYA